MNKFAEVLISILVFKLLLSTTAEAASSVDITITPISGDIY
jgi:hypothetical protein